MVFEEIGMDVRIAGREKTLYSIYRKMDEKHLSFAQVTDIYGFRVIVPGVLDCYTAMGVLHQMYKPVPGKFKDYIAIARLWDQRWLGAARGRPPAPGGWRAQPGWRWRGGLSGGRGGG